MPAHYLYGSVAGIFILFGGRMIDRIPKEEVGYYESADELINEDELTKGERIITFIKDTNY